MKRKIKEADQVTQSSRSEKMSINASELVKSIENGFRQSVKPTWAEWQKDVKISTRGYGLRKSKRIAYS